MRLSAPWQTKWYLGFFIYTFAIAAFGLDPQKKLTQYSHQKWGAADGMDAVNSITQTTDGYLWVAANDGLFRFDGIRFTRWEARAGDVPLPSSPNQVFGAKDGSLWVAVQNHMFRMRDQRLTDYVMPNWSPSARTLQVCEAQDGILWAATEVGLYQFAGKDWHLVELGFDYKGPACVSVYADSENTVWATVFVSRGQLSTRLVYRKPGESRFNVIFEPVFYSPRIAESADGKLWVANISTSTAIHPLDRKTMNFVTPTIRFGVNDICFDRDGNLWMATGMTGIRKIPHTELQTTNDEIANMPDYFNVNDGLSSNFIQCLFMDSEGNIWVGTHGGLDCFRENKVTAFGVREGYPNLVMSVAAKPDGRIGVGTSPVGAGEILWNGKQFEFRATDPIVNEVAGNVLCLYAERDGSLLLSTGLGSGFRVVRDGKQSHFSLPGGLRLTGVDAMTRDSEGALWLCDRDAGIYRIADGKVETFPELKHARNESAITVNCDGKGRVWFGFTVGGVICCDHGKFQKYSQAQGLFGGMVRALASDPSDRLWAAGEGGISIYRDGKFQTLTRANGLPDDDIFAMLLDNNGSFWLAGPRGIFRVSIKELDQALSENGAKVEGDLLTVADGVRGIVRHTMYGALTEGYNVTTKDRDGRLWFSTTEGLAVLDPGKIPKSPNGPVVHIEQLVAAGQNYHEFKNLRLPKGTRDCQIDYVGLHFSDPFRVNYQYKLEGYDRDWINARDRRQAYYSNLRPKKYRFHVRARNYDGDWCDPIDGIEFAIAPAFYQTVWFPISGAALLGLALLAWHRLRLARLTARVNLQLAAQQEERKRIAQELHDTLLQGFTGVGLKLEALTGSLPASMTAIKKKFEETLLQIDQYLVEGRRSVWELRSPTLDSANCFSAALKKVCERALKGTAIVLNFSVTGHERKLPDVVENNLLRICEEAVANAAKHARPTRIEVEVAFDAKEMRMSIRDNGCGFDSNAVRGIKQGHFGLIGIEERTQAIGARFSLNSQPKEGTQISVTLRAA